MADWSLLNSIDICLSFVFRVDRVSEGHLVNLAYGCRRRHPAKPLDEVALVNLETVAR